MSSLTRRPLRRSGPVLAAMLLGAACGGPGLLVETPASMISAEGTLAPDFSVVDHRGETVVLSEASRKTITVLVFYRGAW